MPTESLSGPPPQVAIIGAGLMGHGIAQVFLLGGSTVRVWDPDEKALAGVPARIDDHLALIGVARPADVQLAESIQQAAAGADLIMEAAPENLAVKRRLIAEFDDAAPGAIVATNTSVLRISEIADGSAHPERVVGTHWWNPPYLIPIVEVVPGEQTAKETVGRVSEWLRGVGKTVVPVRRDVPGFVGNRMQFALWREAMSIVQEGICDAEAVDLVARNTVGLRLAAIGPLTNADFIGLDLTKAIMDYLLPSLSTEQRAPGLVRELCEQGAFGAKSGRGIFPWPGQTRDEVEGRLLAHLLEQAGRPATRS